VTTLRRLLIAAVLLLVISFFLTPPVMHFVGQELINRLQERGARVRVDGLAGRRIGLSADVVEAWLSLPLGKRNRFFPISLKIEDAVATVRPPLLSPWAPQVSLRGTSYGGSIAGSIPLLINLARQPNLQLSVVGVDLSLHPQARAFGVEAGIIDAGIEDHPITGLPRVEARYSIDLRGLSANLPPMVAQLAKISSISDGNLSAKAVFKSAGGFVLDPCSFQSSLGSLTLNARGMVSGDSVKDLWGTIRINLDTEQGAQIRPWLGLLVPAARLPAAGPVQCDFRGGVCDGAAGTQVQLGPLCVRLDCRGSNDR
jgi:hypothetical protein